MLMQINVQQQGNVEIVVQFGQECATELEHWCLCGCGGYLVQGGQSHLSLFSAGIQQSVSGYFHLLAYN